MVVGRGFSWVWVGISCLAEAFRGYWWAFRVWPRLFVGIGGLFVGIGGLFVGIGGHFVFC